jgi:hypothetical protein
MQKLLEFLEGKKTVIASVLAVTVSFAVTMNWIAPEVGTYLQTVLGLIFGTAVVATNKLGARRK